MADVYEQNLGQKSSLTTSDYIRVVGSDNVSYKQSVASVLATMGLSLYYTDTNSTSDGSTDMDKYAASFKRILTTFSNSNPTVNRTYPIMIVISGAIAGTFAGVVNVTSTAMRFLLSYNNVNLSGQFVRSGSTITMERLPSRSEIDALTVNQTWNITYNSTYASGGGFVRRYGRVCVLSATAKLVTTGINMVCASVVNGNANNAPDNATWASCDLFSSAGRSAEARVMSNGDLQISAPSGMDNSDLKVHCTWIAKA